MEIKFHGQSCFSLIDGDTHVVIDPFLKPNNPSAVVTNEELDPTHIFASHAHIDHTADLVPLAKRTGAQVAAIVELANWIGEQGVENVSDPNLGGTVTYDDGHNFVSVKLVPAWHTNTIFGDPNNPYSATEGGGTALGSAAGLVVTVNSTTVYHAGDTALFGDMKLIGEISEPAVALLPIGGHYTMDRHDAVKAAELIGADVVIPMHYDTFPPIETESDVFKADVEKQTGSKVTLLEPGESTEV
jgi:L-ascorbate metabolism protein UlaG (beta-lactamase superfamily)